MRRNAQNRFSLLLINTVFLSMLLGACGGGGSSSGSGNNSSSGSNGNPPPSGTLAMQVFAGSVDGSGNYNATGSMANFNIPVGVAVDGAGNVYVADSGNNSIRKVTAAGEVTQLAGGAANFKVPKGVATDSSGNVYVADTFNDYIRKIDNAGTVSILAGSGFVGSADGTGAGASFNKPYGIATDSGGNVYVADTSNNLIRKITAAGVVSTLAGSGAVGSADGTGAAASFNAPQGVATDSAGNVYVTDTGNSTVRKITPGGVVSTLAGTALSVGSLNGTGAAARFSYSQGIAVDSTGNVYVSDSSVATIRKITAAGVVSTLAGSYGQPGSTDGTGTAARFYFPDGLAVDSAGNLYVADGLNHTLRKVTPAGVVTTLAGKAGVRGMADGTGTAAKLNFPYGIAADAGGSLYLADMANHSIRKVSAAGVVSTLAGSTTGGHTDATGAAASFYMPYDVAVDNAGNVFVADTYNHGIRKITAGGVVTTFAGILGFSGSGDAVTGTAAQFNVPKGIAIDSSGNLYVADTNNFTVRKITSAGEVTTLAGTAGASGSADGTGPAASFFYPNAVAVDGAGNVYVSDSWNYTIRKITPAGVVTTLAGAAGVSGSADGTGPAARFGWINAIKVDGAGNVYAADSGSSTIRKITPAGVVTTVIGTSGQAGYVANSLPGVINRPTGLVIIGTTLYFTQLNGIVQVANLP